MKLIYQLKIGDFAPSESTRSFTQEGYLKCVNVRLAKATTPGNAVGDALHQQQQNNNQDPNENKGFDKSTAYKKI